VKSNKEEKSKKEQSPLIKIYRYSVT